MSVIASSRAKPVAAGIWLAFSGVNVTLMYLLPGAETIPYHLVWASFALLYGLFVWSIPVTVVTFSAITIGTGLPLIEHARAGIIGWEECSEIVLMAVIAALLVWHVRRSNAAKKELRDLNESERLRSHYREIATRFGSHELRTRLAIARSVTEMTRDGALDWQTRDDSDLVLTELDKATALCTKLLTFVRLGGDPTDEPTDLNALLGAITRRWVLTAERQWSYQAFPGLIMSDAERLEVVLDCLIENAVKFTEPGDRIAITARHLSDRVLICVADSGAGIPESELERVTGLFEIGHTAGERAGSGLGLGMVRAMIESRGGRLLVASTLHHGTEITLDIPYRRAADRRLAIRSSSASAVTVSRPGASRPSTRPALDLDPAR